MAAISHGFDGPNAFAQTFIDCVKAAEKEESNRREHEKDLAHILANSNSRSSPINPFQPINIVNANSVNQIAQSITNITLTDDQFKELLDSIKNM